MDMHIWFPERPLLESTHQSMNQFSSLWAVANEPDVQIFILCRLRVNEHIFLCHGIYEDICFIMTSWHKLFGNCMDRAVLTKFQWKGSTFMELCLGALSKKNGNIWLRKNVGFSERFLYCWLLAKVGFNRYYDDVFTNPFRIKSSPPRAAYIRQSIRSALVQIIAYRLFGTKPLPEPMLTYCQLDSWEQISMKLVLGIL